MSSVTIFGTPDEEAKIKSFSGTSKGGKHTIRIELEMTDAWRFGHYLEQLDETQKAQNPPKASPSKPTKSKQLALPAPSARLLPPNEN